MAFKDIDNKEAILLIDEMKKLVRLASFSIPLTY
jgi:hypothetical protein